jgi:hypothetical protein
MLYDYNTKTKESKYLYKNITEFIDLLEKNTYYQAKVLLSDNGGEENLKNYKVVW